MHKQGIQKHEYELKKKKMVKNLINDDRNPLQDKFYRFKKKLVQRIQKTSYR
jgi:hypothetical protein